MVNSGTQQKILGWLRRPLTEQLSSIIYHLFVVGDTMFEKRHGFDFDGYVPPSQLSTGYSESLPHAMAYWPCHGVTLRLMLRELEKTGLSFANAIDIGSGKGKACIYAARLSRFEQIIGVEFSQALTDVAEANKRRYSSTNITFLCADATNYTLPPANNVVFIFNPFDEIVLDRFISNNVAHFQEWRSVIAYANDYQRSVLIKRGFETISRMQAPNMSLYRYGGN